MKSIKFSRENRRYCEKCLAKNGNCDTFTYISRDR